MRPTSTPLTCVGFAIYGAASLVWAPGQIAAVPSWDVQSTANAGSDLAAASRVGGTDISSWHHINRPFCTLMGCLISSGVYSDNELFFSDNLKQLSGDQFMVPWLYRAEFALAPIGSGNHVFLITHGINSRADIYLNGKQVADKSLQAGAYGGHRYSITDLASDQNALVVQVYPTSPYLDLTIGWIDWNNAPSDSGTGVWRPVDIKLTGHIVLEPLRVVTRIGSVTRTASTSSKPATVTLKTTARNLENAAVTATASGFVSPVSGGPSVSWEKTVTLGPLSTTEIVLGGVVESPAIWWPKQWGDQPLYIANLTVTAGGGSSVSDFAAARFGFRTVSSRRDPSFDDTTFYVNGEPFQVLGGGYAPDLYLRFDPVKFSRELQYLLDLGLNTIRLEGKNEHPELYEIADRMGVMVLAGWECCSKWEAWSYNPVKDNVAPTPIWSDDDYVIANASVRHEAAMMQTHPSLLAFLVGSDYPPDAKATALYMDAFKAADWPNPIIASASSRAGPGTDPETGLGPSGLRMEGPYDWVPPVYWWDNDKALYGSAAGFGSELSAGGGTPDLPSLRKFLSPTDLEDLWKRPDQNNLRFHMGADASSFRNRTIFNRGLWRRYGAPTSLEDYVQKAQMADYEVTRAQFEAYGSMWNNEPRPATGFIYWMLTGALPSLHWNLWDHYMRPSGNYFGAKKGSQLEHVAYDYVRKAVWLINRSLNEPGHRQVDIQIINKDGKVVYSNDGAMDITTAPNSSKNVASLVSVLQRIEEDAVFLKLALMDGDMIISRNVYWLSPKTEDVLDWDRSDWRHTPASEYSDLTWLNTLLKATVSVAVTGDLRKGEASVLLENLSSAPAVFISLSLVDAEGEEVLPLIWSDNYVTLWPKEKMTVDVKTLEGAVGIPASVRIWGKNVEQVSLSESWDDGSKTNPQPQGSADVPKSSGSRPNPQPPLSGNLLGFWHILVSFAPSLIVCVSLFQLS